MKLILSSLMLGGAAVGYPVLQEPDAELAPTRLARAVQKIGQEPRAEQDDEKRALERAAEELKLELQRLEEELADMRSQVQRGRDRVDSVRSQARGEARDVRERARAERQEQRERRMVEARDRRAARQAVAGQRRAEARAKREIAGVERERAQLERRIAGVVRGQQGQARQQIERELSVLRDELATAEVEVGAVRGRAEARQGARSGRGGRSSGRVQRPEVVTTYGISTGSSPSSGASSGGTVINITVEEGDVHIHANGAEIRTTKTKKSSSAGSSFQINAAAKPSSGFFFETEDDDDCDDEDDCDEEEEDESSPVRYRFGSLDDGGSIYFLDKNSTPGVRHVYGQALDASKVSRLPVNFRFNLETGDLPGTFWHLDDEIEIEFDDAFEFEEVEEEEEIECDIETTDDSHGDHRLVWQSHPSQIVATGSWLPAAYTPLNAPASSLPAPGDEESLEDLARAILNELRGMRADLQQMRNEVTAGARSPGASAQSGRTASR